MRRLKFRLRVERSWSRLTCFNGHFLCVCGYCFWWEFISDEMLFNLFFGSGWRTRTRTRTFIWWICSGKNRSASLFQSLQMCVCWIFEINELHFMLSFLAAFFHIFVRLIAALQMAAIKKNCSTSVSKKKCYTQVFPLVSGISQTRTLFFVVYFPRRLPIYYTCTE